MQLKKNLLNLIPAAMLAVGAVACGDDDENGNGNGGGTDTGNGNGGTDAGNGGDESVLDARITCDANDLCTVPPGTYTEDMVWATDKTFLLTTEVGPDNVTIGAGATLEIRAGVQIFASGRIALVVDRDATILAEGTASNPIVMTSAQPDGSRQRGDWGGVIINGNATANCDPCQGEGNSGMYGGNDDSDSSGVLRYVRIEYGGNQITGEDQYNGIAFQGVGSGTEVDFVQAHLSSDDGVEFFGGTVNAKHLVITGAGDDSLDWTFGWRGKAQFVAVQQYDDEGDRGVEADNNGDNNDLEPRSSPILSNLTLVGRSGSDGILLRRGTAAQVWNTVITGFGDCVDIDGIPSTFDQLTAGNIVYANAVFGCSNVYVQNDEEDENEMPIDDADSNGPVDIADIIGNQQPNNNEANPMLTNVGVPPGTTPNFAPMSGSPAIGTGDTSDDAFFDDVDFSGAVGPDSDWTAGWTAYPAN